MWFYAILYLIFPNTLKVLVCEPLSKNIYILSTPFFSFLVIYHFILEKRKSSEICPRHDWLSFPADAICLDGTRQSRVLGFCLFICSLDSVDHTSCQLSVLMFLIPSLISPQAEFPVQLGYLSRSIVFKL